MSKRRKPKGLLAGQRPKRRWPLFARYGKLSLLAILTLALAVSGISWLHRQMFRPAGNGLERPQLLAAQSLDPEDQVRIRESYRSLDQVNAQTLLPMARQLHQSMGLRTINIIQTAPHRLWIATEPFEAQLLVELDRIRYVTEDGIIFGQLAENEISTLPLLKGLDRKAPLVRSPNGTLIPSSGNQRIIEDTILAIQEGKRYNIQYRSMIYDDFRGLTGELQEPAYRITLGFKPFDRKYLKLDKILASLKQRGLTSATIELDYKGKAFVKETVL